MIMMTKKHAVVKYTKAPQAPRRFKSAYMFFSTEKHKDFRKELAAKGENDKVSKKRAPPLMLCGKIANEFQIHL